MKLNKGFSIITNFGCDNNCSYCIWKQHPLENVFTDIKTFDWIKLKKYIKDYTKISISGGGDPFYKIQENWSWYEKLFDIYDGKIDIHTSIILQQNDLYKYFNKIVLHLNYNRFIFEIEQINKIPNEVRLVFVIDKNLTIEQVKHIKELTNKRFQLSFRELFGIDKNESIINVEKFIINSNVHFIKQGDYNIYYMPNNEVWYNFLGG